MATNADDPHDRLADMDSEKLETLIEHADTLTELAEAREDNSLSRREAVKLAGALGLGGLVGGGGAATAIDSASAQASTSDQYGDVGEPGDRVDVFADGVDTSTVTDTDTGTTYDVGDDLAGSSIFEDTDGDGIYEQTTGDGINVDELSRMHILPPEATDWGAAVNNKLSSMSAGETLFVPPVPYDTSTKAVVDKNVSIVSLSGFDISGNRYPSITKQSDVPILEATENCHIDGLVGDTNVSDTTDGFIFHGKTHVENVHVEKISGVGLLFEQTSGDNLNECVVENVSGSNLGSDLVKITNSTSNASNVNAMNIDIANSFRNSGYALNYDAGFGSFVHIQHCAGSEHTGLARLNTSRVLAVNTYTEGDVPQGFEFQNGNNLGVIIHTGMSYSDMAVYGNGNNKLIQMETSSNPFISPGGDPLKIDRQDFETSNAGSGLIVTTPDGSGRYRIRVDNSGNVVTDAL